jgi:glycosyltransferase involved in cell wall biosynthesis
MDLIDFSKNEDSIAKQAHIESVLLYGNHDVVHDAGITVCIPTYKRPRLLKEAIESAVNQITDIPYQILVVDNDPDFDNIEILDLVKSFNKHNIAYYKNKENLGIYGNLNRCVVLAKTQWTAYLHDDDLLLENYIENISKVLSKHGKKIKGLCCQFIVKDYPFEVQSPSGNIIISFLKKIFHTIHSMMPDIVKIPLSANVFLAPYGVPSCGMLFKRKYFLLSGGFNEVYFPMSDRIFCMSFTSQYNFFRYKKPPLAIYRWEVNASLRKDIQSNAKSRRKLYLLSLEKHNFIYVILFKLFKKDIDTIIKSELYAIVKKTAGFNFVARIYSLFLFKYNPLCQYTNYDKNRASK